MSIAEKLTTVAENMPKVYEAGQSAEYNSFWDSFISKSSIGYAVYFFAGPGWNDKTFRPNKDLVFTNACTGLMRATNIGNLKKCLEDCGVNFDTSEATNLSYAFAYGAFKYLPKISVASAGNKTEYLCGETDTSNRLIWIDEVEVAETSTFVSSFNYCKQLEHAIFTGTLASNGLDLHWSTKLDKESLLSIINILQDRVSLGLSGTRTVTLGSENLAKITDAEKAIATQKGWTLV